MIGRVIYIFSLKCHFNIKFDQHSVERSRLPPNLQIDIEIESSEAILLNVRKICREICKLFTFFGKTRFSIEAVISNAFVPTKDAKNRRNRLNLSYRKTRLQNMTSAYINRFGPP